MLTYALFYRRGGIRRVDQLSSPVLTPLNQLELPIQSLVHFLGTEIEVGPERNHFFIRDLDRTAWLSHTYELKRQEGRPRRHMINYDGEIRNYHRKNPRIKLLLKPIAAITDQRTLVLCSYTGLSRRYKYVSTPMTKFYKWGNEWTSIIANVASIAEQSPRNQFIPVELPDIIPPLSTFRKAEDNMSVINLRPFNNPAKLTMLDLWLWLGEGRERSILSAIPIEHLNKINLFFLIKGNYCVLNLGLLNSWRTTPDAEAEKLGEDGIIKGVDSLTLQKRFLHFLLNTSGVQLPSVDTAIDEVEAEDTEEVVEVVDPAGSAKLTKPAGVSRAAFKLEDEDEETDIKRDVDEEETEVTSSDITELDIDEDLEVHDQLISQKKTLLEEDAEEEGSVTTDFLLELDEVEPYQIKSLSIEEVVIEKAQRMVEQGILSVPEYRRAQDNARKYKSLTNPVGNGTVADAIDIKPEDLKLDPKPVPDLKTVLDKSMLKSTLNDFDPVYIDKLMHRDILSSVMSVQRAGIAVTDISVTETADALNHYMTYSVKLAPPAGKQTTISFKIPVVDENGTIISGGVNYYLKKQRGDVPIRKVGPSRVALTSYYGKLFVDRNENATVNYGRWINNHIRAMGLDSENTTITNMKMANNFNPKVKVPRNYSALAMSFKSFTVKPVNGSLTDAYHFYFNISDATKHFGEARSQRVAQEGDIIVGEDQNKSPIGMSESGALTLYRVGGNKSLGSLEALVGLPEEKIPTEIAMVNIFGKSVPMVVVLGYHMGILKLMKLLGLTPRFVERGRRMNLKPNEYSVAFKDYSMILPRDDRRATLVMAGLKAYHRSVSNYDFELFDSPDVYVNLMESVGLGARYAREIDMIYDMYIDDITRGLLVDMGEPTEMVGLFLRSAELLVTDQHPEEIDGALTRYRGYERFAGIVYQELVKACRLKAARPVSQRVGLELNPEAVWQQILQDSSMEVTNDINPIQNLKQKEVVTFGGTGGRKADTMVKRTRTYHEKDVGVISEATVDSGAVGVISYFSADPNIIDLRGRVREFNPETDGTSTMLSTSALLSPAALNDDPKRVEILAPFTGNSNRITSLKRETLERDNPLRRVV